MVSVSSGLLQVPDQVMVPSTCTVPSAVTWQPPTDVHVVRTGAAVSPEVNEDVMLVTELVELSYWYCSVVTRRSSTFPAASPTYIVGSMPKTARRFAEEKGVKCPVSITLHGDELQKTKSPPNEVVALG